MRRRALLAVAITIAVAGALPLPAVAADEGDQGGPGLVEVGTIARDFTADALRAGMAVDQRLALGFTYSHQDGDRLTMWDLHNLEPLDESPFAGAGLARDPARALVPDPRRERSYYLTGYGLSGLPESCQATPAVTVFDYRVDAEGERQLRRDWIGTMPCTGPLSRYGFKSLQGAYYEADEAGGDRLYIAGVPANETAGRGALTATNLQSVLLGDFKEDRGQGLLIRQVSIEGDALVSEVGDIAKAAQLRLEWEIDLRHAGCGRREAAQQRTLAFVERVGNDVVAYCWDTRPYKSVVPFGQAGYVVRIPLVRDEESGVMRPATRGGEAPITDPLGAPESVLNYEAVRTPALAGDVAPFVDQLTRRLFLTTSGSVNGNAVWVFDVRGDRFIGVATGGATDQPHHNTAAGFDPDRGRIYLLTKDGILVVDGRQTPLGGGTMVPVLTNDDGTDNFAAATRIAVLGSSRRVFVPVCPSGGCFASFSGAGRRYVVLEDVLPQAPSALEHDPDSLTTQIEEADGVTIANASGQAMAVGAHIVVTGGAPRMASAADPSCRLDPPDYQYALSNPPDRPRPEWTIAPNTFAGSCLADLVLTPGARNLSISATEVEAGTSVGAYARAVGLESTDHATSADARRPTDCGASVPAEAHQWGRDWPFPDDEPHPDAPSNELSGEQRQGLIDSMNERRDEFWDGAEDEQGDVEESEFARRRRAFVEGDPNNPQDGYEGTCSEAWDGAAGSGVDLRRGSSAGRAGGFVVPAAQCVGLDQDQAGVPVAPHDLPDRPFAVDARCDSRVPQASAKSSNTGQGFSMVDPSGTPVLSVESTASSIETSRVGTADVTVAAATASDVSVGPLQIGEVRTIARTQAGGRTGTASASLERRWCGVVLPGVIEEPTGCFDPEAEENADLVDQLIGGDDAPFLRQVELSMPSANGEGGHGEATPGGYQAVITKDPGQRAGDQAVNDDDSHTVAGLQAVFYNDGAQGRSRLIVQLAGVHAEARYGITLLPRFSGFEGSFTAGSTSEATPATRRVIPGTRRVPTAATVIEGEAFEELLSTAQPLPENPVRRFLGFLPEALGDLWRLFVQHPLEFLFLFFVFSLLGTPAYLAYRRRTFVGVVAHG